MNKNEIRKAKDGMLGLFGAETLVRWFSKRRIDPLKCLRPAYNELNGTVKAVGRIAPLLGDNAAAGREKEGAG